MNTTILTQQSANVKPSPKVIPSIAWAWGFEDGAQRKSIYTGYHLFAGVKLGEYKRGWAEGKRSATSR